MLDKAGRLTGWHLPQGPLHKTIVNMNLVKGTLEIAMHVARHQVMIWRLQAPLPIHVYVLYQPIHRIVVISAPRWLQTFLSYQEESEAVCEEEGRSSMSVGSNQWRDHIPSTSTPYLLITMSYPSAAHASSYTSILFTQKHLIRSSMRASSSCVMPVRFVK